MKKILLFVAVSVFAGASVVAAPSMSNLSIDIEKKCTESTRALANALLLNEAEYIKLKSLNRERLLKLDEVSKTFTNDVVTREARMQEVEKEFTKKVRKFLTPSQMQAFANYRQVPNVRYIVAISE